MPKKILGIKSGLSDEQVKYRSKELVFHLFSVFILKIRIALFVVYIYNANMIMEILVPIYLK